MTRKRKKSVLQIVLHSIGTSFTGTLVAFGIFAVIFWILNALNIISLPFFPHKTNIPSPANYTTANFSYDTQKVKTILTQYMKDNLKANLLPAQIEIKQTLASGNTQSTPYEFLSRFSVGNDFISGVFYYQENTNVAREYGIVIQLVNVADVNAPASTANSLASSYFKNPYAISDCQTKRALTYCGNLQTLSNGKKGYGVMFGNKKANTTSLIVNCFIPKESKDYATTKSCANL